MRFPAEVEEPRRIAPAGAWARRGQSLRLSALEENEGSAGGSERARGHQQVKAGAWAWCQATAAARRASPAQGGHAAGELYRGRDARRGASASRRAEAGQRGAGLGRGEARARGLRWAGLRGWAGKEAAARENRKTLFHLYFQELFKSQLSNLILSKKMTSFENVPKMKVA